MDVDATMIVAVLVLGDATVVVVAPVDVLAHRAHPDVLFVRPSVHGAPATPTVAFPSASAITATTIVHAYDHDHLIANFKGAVLTN